MKFSIVMASYLGFYSGAARDRDKKILRAIASVQHQTYKSFEIIVVADGCEKTMQLVEGLDKVRSFIIPKAKKFSGEPRNKGIDEALGEWIVYLDIDDVFGENHLKIINKEINKLENKDWVYFNDYHYDVRWRRWRERPCDITTMGRNGTSNVAHKKIGARWKAEGYAHDYYFVQELRKYKNYVKIATPQYFVMHKPGTTGAGGYDL